MGKVQKERRKFSSVTLGASVISAVLFTAAGMIATSTGNFYNHIIVALLAMLSMGLALQSAKLEGLNAGVKK